MQKEKKIILGILTILFFVLCLVLLSGNKKNQKAALAPAVRSLAEDLFYYDSQGNRVRLTEDGGNGVSYLAPIINSAGNVLVVRCAKQDCAIEEIGVDGSARTLYRFVLVNKFVSQEFFWSPDLSYMVILVETNLITFDWKEEKIIKSWDVLGFGVGGGSYCNTAVFSSDSEYFAFCKASAQLLTIQGDLFVFNRDGLEVLSLTPEREEEGKDLISPRFEGNTLHYFDESTSTERSVVP